MVSSTEHAETDEDRDVAGDSKSEAVASQSDSAAELAKVKGVSQAELAQATTENFFRLYNKTPRTAVAA